MRESIEICEKFLDLLTTIDKNYDALYDKVGSADKETQDLLHDLEFGNYGAKEIRQKALAIKRLRRERREAKNTMELINPLRDYMKNHMKTKIDLHKIIQQMKLITRDQGERVYVPRVQHDLPIARQHFSSGEQHACIS